MCVLILLAVAAALVAVLVKLFLLYNSSMFLIKNAYDIETCYPIGSQIVVIKLMPKLHRQTEWAIFQVHSVFKRYRPDTSEK